MRNEITVTSVVDQMQELIDEVKNDKKMELEKRVKLISQLTDRQLRAGALNLAYHRAISRLPEGADGTSLKLSSPRVTNETRQ